MRNPGRLADLRVQLIRSLINKQINKGIGELFRSSEREGREQFGNITEVKEGSCADVGNVTSKVELGDKFNPKVGDRREGNGVARE